MYTVAIWQYPTLTLGIISGIIRTRPAARIYISSHFIPLPVISTEIRVRYAAFGIITKLNTFQSEAQLYGNCEPLFARFSSF
jgi:hypothetical protein